MNPGQVNDSTLELSNSIVRSTGTPGMTASASGDGAPTTIIRHSNIAPSNASGDGVVVQSEGNQTADPQFVAPAAGEFRLQATSPSIDAGSATAALAPYDLAGVARTQDGNHDGVATPDQGAYELPGPPRPAPPASQPPASGDGASGPGAAGTSGSHPAGSHGDRSHAGGARRTCRVPRLKGLTRRRALRRLRRAGCRAGSVHRARARVQRSRSGRRRPLVVRRQSVRPGRRIARSRKVSIVLGVRSRGGSGRHHGRRH